MAAFIVYLLIAVTAGVVGLAITGLRPRSSQWQSLPVAAGLILACCFLGLRIPMIYRIIGATLEVTMVLVFMIRSARMVGGWQSLKLTQHFKNSCDVVYITWAARHIIWLVLRPRIKMWTKALPILTVAYCIRLLQRLEAVLKRHVDHQSSIFKATEFA